MKTQIQNLHCSALIGLLAKPQGCLPSTNAIKMPAKNQNI